MTDTEQQLPQSLQDSLIVRLVAHFVHAGGLANKVTAVLSPDRKPLEPASPNLQLQRLCDKSTDEICPFTTRTDKENTSEGWQGSACKMLCDRFLPTAHSDEFFFIQVCLCVPVHWLLTTPLACASAKGGS